MLADDEKRRLHPNARDSFPYALFYSWGYWENLLFWVLSFPGLFVVLSRLISVQYIRESRTIL